jgi:hypothetical protein
MPSLSKSDLDVEAGLLQGSKNEEENWELIEALQYKENFEECSEICEICQELQKTGLSNGEIQLMKTKFLEGELNYAGGDELEEISMNSESIFIMGKILYYRGNLANSAKLFDNVLQMNSTISQAAIMKTNAEKLITIISQSELNTCNK